jgi:hypothetical protein
MNHSDLSQLIQDYCETSEMSFVANIPRFVRQAEQRVYRTVTIPALRKVTTLITTPSGPLLEQPSDFLLPLSLAVIDASGQYSFLYDKDPSFIREAYPGPFEGLPRFYALQDAGHFVLGPTPDAEYSVELQYQYDPEPIMECGTSWLGENAESVLLYGSLVEAYTYLKGDADMMAQYRQRYDTALRDLASIDVRTKRDDYRDGQIRLGG